MESNLDPEFEKQSFQSPRKQKKRISGKLVQENKQKADFSLGFFWRDILFGFLFVFFSHSLKKI